MALAQEVARTFAQVRAAGGLPARRHGQPDRHRRRSPRCPSSGCRRSGWGWSAAAAFVRPARPSPALRRVARVGLALSSLMLGRRVVRRDLPVVALLQDPHAGRWPAGCVRVEVNNTPAADRPPGGGDPAQLAVLPLPLHLRRLPRRRARHRRGHRQRRRGGAGPGRQAGRRRRDRSRAHAARPRPPPRPALRRPAGHHARRRRPGVHGAHAPPLRPDPAGAARTRRRSSPASRRCAWRTTSSPPRRSTQARSLLKPGGTFAMYNYYEPWLLDRYANTMRTVYGTAPCVQLGPSYGPRQQAVLTPAQGRQHRRLHARPGPRATTAARAVRRRPAVPVPRVDARSRRFYLWMLGLVLLASVVLVRVTVAGRCGDAAVRRPVLHGRGVPAAGDQERRAVRAAVRHHLGGQRGGLRRRPAERAGGDRGGPAGHASAGRSCCMPRCWPPSRRPG